MIIVGAGMAGLLAAAMLRNECSGIIEAQPIFPNNHSAVLRFRTSIVGDTLNIPFRPVDVIKAIHPWMNPIADVASYSLKTNGTVSLRSAISASGEIEKRWIAPEDLIAQMYGRLPNAPEFGVPLDKGMVSEHREKGIISTIPMPALMEILDYPEPRPSFRSIEGININAKIRDCDMYASLYVPDPKRALNRLSLTGDRLTIEIAFPGVPGSHVDDRMEQYRKGSTGLRDIVIDALSLLGFPNGIAHVIGVPEVTRSRYSKIVPIDDNSRKRFIMWASDTHRIFSLGRFATWRPKLLLDDVVNDVRVIRKIFNHGTYDHRR